VQIAGFDARPFSFANVAHDTSPSRTKSARRPLVWLSMVLVGSGLLAAALLASLPWPHRDEETASVKTPAQGRPAKSKPATKTALSPRKQASGEGATAAPSKGSAKGPSKPSALDGFPRSTQPDEQPEPMSNDCSVSGWVMLALKTAREAKIKLERGTIPRMTAFFARHQVRDRTYYFSPTQQGTDAMTGVGMMVVEFFQNKHDSPFVSRGARYLADRAEARHAGGATPAPDYYLWYNCTMAMFQAGGEAWERWNRAVRDEVIGLQVHGESCERGSWPPNDQWSTRGGRIYSTALVVLTLEVYYRFQRVAGQSENQPFFSK
jgi:hypothetical protein